MAVLVGLVGLTSKHAAFSRTVVVPVVFNDGTDFVNSRFHIGVFSKSFFLFFIYF